MMISGGIKDLILKAKYSEDFLYKESSVEDFFIRKKKVLSRASFIILNRLTI